MCPIEDMRGLARDLYATAEEYRPLQPALADLMVAQADDILKQFGPLDCPSKDEHRPETPIPADEDEQFLRLMRKTKKIREESFIPVPEPRGRLGIFRGLF